MNQSAAIKLRAKNISSALLAFSVAVAMFAMPEAAASGCAEGVQLCLDTAVPSLFPMMFAAVFATETGLTQFLGRLTAPAAKCLFGLPEEAGGAVIMAVTGGFPAGAKTVCGLMERGAADKEESARMCLFCFAAGPAFLLGAVGKIYGSVHIGAVLLIIQLISVVIVGMLTKLLKSKRIPGTGQCHEHQINRKAADISTAFTRSAAQTASAMLNICLYIIIFSIVRKVLDSSGISGAAADLLTGLGLSRTTAEAIIPVLLEVTSGCASAAKAGLPVTAFAVGFGGLAVHMQVLAIAQNTGMKYGLFLAARFVQGLLCALMMQIYISAAPEPAVSVYAAVNSPSISTTPAGAVVLVVMSVMLLLCLPDGRFRADTKFTIA